MNIFKERWVADKGNIATERIFDYKTAYGLDLKDRRWIAFNVGQKVAEHIVELHNRTLENP